MKKYYIYIYIYLFIIILIVIAICYSININNNKTKKINNSVTINDIDNISSVMLKEETEGGYIYYKTENKELIQEIIKALNNIQIGEKVDVMFNDSGRYYIIEYNNGKTLTYYFQSNYYNKNNVNYRTYNYKYTLSNKYGSLKESITSLSTYKDIINNRYADYDENSKKYTVSDNASLYNYLVSEYSSGRMSSSDLANLKAMYNVTQPTDSDIAKAERIKYLVCC